jgi:Uma2 family endonuclease
MSASLLFPEQQTKTLRALGPDCNGMLMTPEEFDAIEDFAEGYIYELINGVLVTMTPPVPAERGPNGKLEYWLRTYQEQHPQGATLDGTLSEEYVRTATGRRRADRVIWTGLGRVPNPRADVPTIVVELVSAGTRNRRRDYLTKRQEYLALGVAEYWIIDRFRRTLTVCRANAADGVVQENEVYQTALLPGFELPLDQLLAEADRWAGIG